MAVPQFATHEVGVLEEEERTEEEEEEEEWRDCIVGAETGEASS